MWLWLLFFVVMFGGQLGWFGVMLMIFGSGGVVIINSDLINIIVSGMLSVVMSWVVMFFGVVFFGVWMWLWDERRCRSGFVVLLCSVSVFKVGVVFGVGIVVVWICNINWGVLILICGVFWVVLVVFGVLVLSIVLLSWICFGCYVYVIGGGVEGVW